MKQRTIYKSQEYTVSIVFILPNMTEVTALTFLSIHSLQVLIKEVINPEFPECFGPLRKTAIGQFCFFNIGGWPSLKKHAKKFLDPLFQIKEFEEQMTE